MKRVASIDIGTNSTRFLVAEYDGAHLNRIETGQITTRLGKRMAGGKLLPETMLSTADAVGLFYQKALDLGAGAVTAAATSAVRDASNQADFLEMIEQRTGLPVRVLSGEEEAALSWRGVLSGLPVGPCATLVIDIGGGSTEFIWMRGARLRLVSVNAGAVRLTAAGAGEAVTYKILRPALEEVQRCAPAGLVGVGGTITALAAIDQQLALYDPDRVHGYNLSLLSVQRILKMLQNLEVEERRKMPGLQPARADIIVAGVDIARIIMENLGLESMLVSECDILYGLALTEVERK
ncbi:MAG: Ppx/GppA family phosphatase [Desulfotomaculaceae bacterium]|nr:Ppx/GppA family phosphatase [Desulfotomaculaceae bacterium]MDD4766794.1 Ppx/GppA family phosphatase [Desulfotomaculaceae bacterium]